MDALSPSISVPADTHVVEGHAVGPFVRICGMLCFLVLDPLFIYVWIDDPKFVQGPIDSAEIFMAIVTAGMLFLGCGGLMMNFAKTRITADVIEWRRFRRRRLDLDRIRHVDHVVRVGVLFFPVVSIMRLVTDESKRIEITGGTKELHRAFLRLEERYPK